MKLWQSKYNSQCNLTQHDLRDISDEITQIYAPHNHHHQPELVLMPVDPINLYAYWNLKENETDTNINHVDKQLALRIFSIPEISEHHSKLQLSFDIQVYGFQNQQKVHLPVAATAYSAVIGEINTDNSFSALATSDTIHVPRENPVAKNSLNNHENTVQIDSIQENNFFNEPNTTVENQEPKNNVNTTGHNSHIDQTPATLEVHEDNRQDDQCEPYILKNFNDYGYDLLVYKNELQSEFKDSLTNQGIKTNLSTQKTHTVNKNTSGKGRLL